MAQLYALKRYEAEKRDWTVPAVWCLLFGFGLTEAAFSVYGFYKALELFLHRMGL